jgi:hypothetical protein
MDRYLIETPHTDENCQRLINELHALGFLHNFEWGCDSGVHSGWAIIEAESEAQARLAVPPLVRNQARVVKLNKYEIGEIKSLHEHKP